MTYELGAARVRVAVHIISFFVISVQSNGMEAPAGIKSADVPAPQTVEHIPGGGIVEYDMGSYLLSAAFPHYLRGLSDAPSSPHAWVSSGSPSARPVGSPFRKSQYP